MNIQQLAEKDAQFREEVRRGVIRNEEAALQRARDRRARTDAIQRHLDRLNQDRCHWHYFQDGQSRCYERAIPGGSFCAEHLIQSQP